MKVWTYEKPTAMYRAAADPGHGPAGRWVNDECWPIGLCSDCRRNPDHIRDLAVLIR